VEEILLEKGSNLAEFCGDQLHRSRATGRDDGGSDRVGLVGGWVGDTLKKGGKSFKGGTLSLFLFGVS
jgi:hypothetical protein